MGPDVYTYLHGRATLLRSQGVFFGQRNGSAGASPQGFELAKDSSSTFRSMSHLGADGDGTKGFLNKGRLEADPTEERRI